MSMFKFSGNIYDVDPEMPIENQVLLREIPNRVSQMDIRVAAQKLGKTLRVTSQENERFLRDPYNKRSAHIAYSDKHVAQSLIEQTELPIEVSNSGGRVVYVKALAYKKRPTKSETKEWRLNENDLAHNPIDKINKP